MGKSWLPKPELSETAQNTIRALARRSVENLRTIMAAIDKLEEALRATATLPPDGKIWSEQREVNGCSIQFWFSRHYFEIIDVDLNKPRHPGRGFFVSFEEPLRLRKLAFANSPDPRAMSRADLDGRVPRHRRHLNLWSRMRTLVRPSSNLDVKFIFDRILLIFGRNILHRDIARFYLPYCGNECRIAAKNVHLDKNGWSFSLLQSSSGNVDFNRGVIDGRYGVGYRLSLNGRLIFIDSPRFINQYCDAGVFSRLNDIGIYGRHGNGSYRIKILNDLHVESDIFDIRNIDCTPRRNGSGVSQNLNALSTAWWVKLNRSNLRGDLAVRDAGQLQRRLVPTFVRGPEQSVLDPRA